MCPEARMFELESSAMSVKKSEEPVPMSMDTVPLSPNDWSIEPSPLYLAIKRSTVSPSNLVPPSMIFPIGLDRNLVQLINTVGFCYYKPTGTEIIIQSAITVLEAHNSEICVAVIPGIYPNQEFIGFDRNLLRWLCCCFLQVLS